MFERNYKNKYALLMCNEIEGCKEDIIRLEKLTNMFNFITFKKIVCFPKLEIESFIKNLEIEKDDLLYLHYSGHGKKRGVLYNGKVEIMSSWLNPDKTVVLSHEIDDILSKVKCSIILTTECCHSETFGKYYKGSNPFIFIGTSKLNMINKTFSLKGEPLHGCLLHLFEYMTDNNTIINIDNIKKISKIYFKENKIQNNLILINK